MVLTNTSNTSTSSLTIRYIIRISPKIQVVESTALRVVAAVEHILPGRDRSSL